MMEQFTIERHCTAAKNQHHDAIVTIVIQFDIASVVAATAATTVSIEREEESCGNIKYYRCVRYQHIRYSNQTSVTTTPQPRPW